MEISKITIKIKSQTSDGGYIELSLGSAGEVQIVMVQVKGVSRNDVRVDAEDLQKALAILQAAQVN